MVTDFWALTMKWWVETYFGVAFQSPSVVLTTGTFLGGLGLVTSPCQLVGGEFAAEGLTETLNQLGFETGRLKQGHQRVDKRSLNYSQLEPQLGDEEVRWFSLTQLFG